MRSLDQVMSEFSPERRARIEAKTRRLIRAETLRQLRAVAKKTQVDVAAATGIAQHNVSRLEQREDMLLSTLRAYVDGLGGRLRLFAEFPRQDPVELDLTGRPVVPRKKQAAAKRKRTA